MTSEYREFNEVDGFNSSEAFVSCEIRASRSHRNSVARKSEGRNFAENPAPLSARLYLARIIAELGIGTRHEMARLKI